MLVFFTQSRGSFLAILLTIILIFTILDWKKGLITAILILSFIIPLIKYSDKIRVISRIESSITSKEKIKKEARYPIFMEGIKKAKEFSLLGEGFYKYQNSNIKSYHVTHYHNNFIETAVTQGSLTLIAYIIFLINLFISMVKNYLKENDRLKKYIKLLAISTFVFINFYGLIEVSFYFEKIYQLVFTIIAISFIIDDNQSL